jgi:dipeptidyl aminopeptidase/acylaminoacyl peptidase
MPSLAELAQPMLRLAGTRINPRTNGLHRAVRYRTLTIKSPSDGIERKVTLPAEPALGWIGFSPDSTRFAFTHTRDQGIELWVGDTATGAAKAITPTQLNNALGSPQSPSACKWVGQGASLLCAFVLPGRGQPPAPPAVPAGPNIQENRGVPGPVRTYQDLLTSAYDETLFEYYATSQLALVDAATGARTPVGRPAIFHTYSPSPDGNFVLIARTKRPFSWLVPYDDFPTAVEVWDRKGAVVKQIADLPVADTVPNGGVLPGPRAWRWQATAPATVTWAEALDGGDPKATLPHRDTVMTLAAPFTSTPTELAKTEWRFAQLAWTEAGVGMLTENDRKTRMTRTWLVDAPGATPRKLWERSQEDSYGNPGTPLRRTMGSGADAIRQVGDAIYLTGSGSTPAGDRPFLDKLDLKTQQKERLFQKRRRVMPRPWSASSPRCGACGHPASRATDAQIFTRDLKANRRVALSSYRSAPPLKGAKAEMVTYQRKDGVNCAPPSTRRRAGRPRRAACRRCCGPTPASSPIPAPPAR